jgi:hypothetical protein
MPVRLTTYTYPWDLARLGVEQSLRELAAQGIDAVDLASTYHPIDALSPRGGGARLFTSPRGAVHFPARTARYGRIKPSVSSPEVCGVWPKVAERAPSLGLAVHAWTVTLYQPWIVDAYPECARVLPSGDAIGSGLCASNDDVREYVAALCADIAEQFGVRMIRLEGIMPSAYDYGWLRPRVLLDLSPLTRELLAVCFCPSCVRRASADGLDVDRLRKLVNDAIANELHDGSATATTDVTDNAELRAFVAQHERAAIELARAAASKVQAPQAPLFSATAWTPYSSLLDGAHDELLEELALAVDQLTLVRAADGARVRRLVAGSSTVAQQLRLAMLLPRLRLGANPAAPHANAEVPKELREGIELGVEEINLYNYGLLRERDIRDLVELVRTTFH